MGPGPLSRTTTSDSSGLLLLTYDRFTRHVADTTLQFQVSPAPTRPGMAQLWISSEYLSSVQVQQVQPEPQSWVGVGSGVLLTFPVRVAESITVQLQIRPDQIGMLPGTAGVPGQQPVRFWQFAYP